jgi:hypothetical protein
MGYKNMAHALLQAFEAALDKEFWSSESELVAAYAHFNKGEQLDCEMINTAVSEDSDGKNMMLSVLLGNKEYRVSVQVYDAETGRRLYVEDEQNE